MKNESRPPIAVVGLGLVFPGARDVETFWSNVVTGVAATREVPAHRWVAAPDAMWTPEPKPDKAYSKRACLVEPFSCSPRNLALDPALIADLDPLYHMVLHAGRQAWESCRREPIAPERSGVILAAIALPTDSASRLTRRILGKAFDSRLIRQIDPSTATDPPSAEPGLSTAEAFSLRVTSLPAALLAQALELRGGSYTLDAACASSLYAVKLACDALQTYRADAMLAGGVSRPECLYTQVGFSQLRALSPSGRCAPFDRTADGLVVGEGSGLVVLKRLDDARAHGDRILGVIRGLGLSNDIGGNLLAPNSEGQLRAMKAAYRQAGWPPSSVDLVECHGAGTPLGDAVELRSLQALWNSERWRPGQCAIGSIKSMIGHLLTAAGAAGLIKTLLAIEHRTLPPSLGFREAPEHSPLKDGPFRVQTRAGRWRKPADVRRRAAVSAFGFGGINAHLLLEEWNAETAGTPGDTGRADPQPETTVSTVDIQNRPTVPEDAVAVVGMAAASGSASREAFAQALINGREAIDPLPVKRWNGGEAVAAAIMAKAPPPGAYLDHFVLAAERFHIPPREIPDILIQQLLMLQVAAEAMLDARLSLREERSRAGLFIGMDFDTCATDFHLRWNLHNRVNEWRRQFFPDLTPEEAAAWLEKLRDACGPPLTHVRTLGALGGIVASRIAREFRIGGPSFTVSAESASGLRAVEIATRSLQQGEVDLALAGAVDLAGDVRAVVGFDALRPLASSRQCRPFDRLSEGTFPGEGAAALVLKRLDDALRDGDPVHAVVTGLGSACGGDPQGIPYTETYLRSLRQALDETGIEPADLSFYEAHASGCPSEDRIEAQALEQCFAGCAPSGYLGTSKPALGHCGAAAGMISLFKTCLCLRRRTIPAQPGPLPNGDKKSAVSGLRRTAAAIPWPWEDGAPPYAAVAAMTTDGNCAHVALQGGPGAPASAPQPFTADRPVRLPTGRKVFEPPLPSAAKLSTPSEAQTAGDSTVHRAGSTAAAPVRESRSSATLFDDLAASWRHTTEMVTAAHETFLDFSRDLTYSFEQTFRLQTDLLQAIERPQDFGNEQRPIPDPPPAPPARRTQKPLLDREMCLEFAVGSAARVLGPEFAEVDAYRARVRLPDEPLMLVDRILEISGVKGSLGSGRVVTEHDVLPAAWYLDGDRAPVCIAVEAGQADLFLSGYLGIDLAVRGERTYRLLDAAVTFHRGLPRPGDTIRYTIDIDRFVRQDQTHLFFFRFEGYIGDEHLISMRNGCAGFFTPEEVERSGGILLTDEERARHSGQQPDDWRPLAPLQSESFDDAGVEALRRGDLATCFGTAFAGRSLAPSLHLPGGRMKLVDRIRTFDPQGGRYGLGRIEAEADIDPRAWFLTCHFVDDMVMPGTLMYECCAHTLRIFLQRLGWVTDKPAVCYEPLEEREAVLKCRGPVTPETRQVIYRVDIRELGYGPEPYAVADAQMFADDRHIVMFRGLSMKMTGITREEIETSWAAPKTAAAADRQPLCFDRRHILAFAVGKPSEAFGEPYRAFDRERKIARLPGPPYSFIDGIVSIEPEPFRLEPGGWVEAVYDVPPDAWYFRANRSPIMPFCVLLETALQPCGWLAAYLGSCLHSHQDLKFRNLDGDAVLHAEIRPDTGRLTMRCRLTRCSRAGEMIIEQFDFQVLQPGGICYEGFTVFGFFTAEALAEQRGLGVSRLSSWQPSAGQTAAFRPRKLEALAPRDPEDPADCPGPPLSLPAAALQMIDTVDLYLPDGGQAGLGYIQGTKRVDPREWFFAAHFFQDPVCPGSLGLEAFLQLLKFAAGDRWPHLADSHRFQQETGMRHRWSYRGQVIPTNTEMRVEAHITCVEERPTPLLRADGYLQVDGLCIYEMKDFGLRLVPADDSSGPAG